MGGPHATHRLQTSSQEEGCGRSLWLQLCPTDRSDNFMNTEVKFITTARAAEENAAARMRELGFVDARATGHGPDGGIDVRASNALAQVKWKGAQTGRPELQNLYGARGLHHDKQLLFFTASGYSKDAIYYANMVGIALFTYDPTGALTSHNDLARRMLHRPDSLSPATTSSTASRPPLSTLVGWTIALLYCIWRATDNLNNPSEIQDSIAGALFVVGTAVCAIGLIYQVFRRYRK